MHKAHGISRGSKSSEEAGHTPVSGFMVEVPLHCNREGGEQQADLEEESKWRPLGISAPPEASLTRRVMIQKFSMAGPFYLLSPWNRFGSTVCGRDL